MNPKEISCCLITKDPIYPAEVLAHTASFGFGEILILTNCDSPYRKHELFKKAKFETIYYSDDDAICPITDLLALSKPDIINLAIKQGHFDAYKDSRASMGLGWGSIFPRKLLSNLKLYTDVYGEDEVYKRETERIFTYLTYPQNRLVLPIQDLPFAYESSRLWRQKEHIPFKQVAEERCAQILINETNKINTK